MRPSLLGYKGPISVRKPPPTEEQPGPLMPFSVQFVKESCPEASLAHQSEEIKAYSKVKQPLNINLLRNGYIMVH
jgi:hypothetical protein